MEGCEQPFQLRDERSPIYASNMVSMSLLCSESDEWVYDVK